MSGRWQKWKEQYRPSTTWGTRDHAAVSRQECSECGANACVWQRCQCRVYFARCSRHLDVTPTQMRAKHQCAPGAGGGS